MINIWFRLVAVVKPLREAGISFQQRRLHCEGRLLRVYAYRDRFSASRYNYFGLLYYQPYHMLSFTQSSDIVLVSTEIESQICLWGQNERRSLSWTRGKRWKIQFCPERERVLTKVYGIGWNFIRNPVSISSGTRKLNFLIKPFFTRQSLTGVFVTLRLHFHPNQLNFLIFHNLNMYRTW